MSKLKKLRIKKGLTLTEVAKSVGTDPGNLLRIERGQVPGRELALRIHKYYGPRNISIIDIIFPDIGK